MERWKPTSGGEKPDWFWLEI